MNRLMLCIFPGAVRDPGGDVFDEELTMAIALMPFNPASKMKRLIHKLIRIQQTASGQSFQSVDPRGMAAQSPWVVMLLNLDTSWLLMTVATVAVFGFFFGTALDAIMRDDGFGSTGNTLLFTLGFFVAVMVANEHGISLRDLKLAIAWGLGGAFAFISTMAFIKAGLARW
ncbi:hypothetical protein LJR234_001864 [Mesorhizobium amorphae]|uniref:hypothetical protein n=1 Tax=Mesorhizobium amorphae TaxID=71433 RepID=UPI003ECE812D